MAGVFDDFDVEDDLLRSLPLDFPFEEEEASVHDDVSTSDADSGICTSEPEPEVPREFLFPFTPYDIQVSFMQNLYKTIELGKIGIFESPTGTGKSLSLICGALTWLRDFEDKQRKELEKLMEGRQEEQNTAGENKPNGEKTELDWITAFAKKQEQNEKAKKLKEEQELRLKREARLQELRNNLRPVQRYKRKRENLEDQFNELFKDAPKDLKEKFNQELGNGENVDYDTENNDDDIVVSEYHSDDDKRGDKSDSEDDDDDDEHHITKIYFCSRTHSQLAQFVREIQKSPFGESTRVVSLGSRQNLCINESVKKLKALSFINDRCLELQKNKDGPKRKNGEAVTKRKRSSGGCPFYKQDPMMEFRDRALLEVKDVEQLVTMGRQMKACPYYGTRYGIASAQVVALPYNTLLHKATRDACGIKLKGNIVVIDEAHNLIETISNVHSMEISGAQVTCAYSQLTQYMERYRSRLKAKNLMYIKQILFVLSSFIKCLGGKAGFPADKQKISKTETRLQTINDFLFDQHLDNLNLFKVTKYCERSLISKKLHGFVEKYQPSITIHNSPEKKKEEGPSWALSKFLKEISRAKDNIEAPPPPPPPKSNDENEDSSSSFSSPLMHIEGFLEALTNANRDGRIVINKQGLLSKSSLKFLLLNPAVHFADVVSEARAVIVAGGTMQPLSEFKDQLFYSAGVQPSRILEYSCGHVIPSEQLLPIALARGSSGLELDFTYNFRDAAEMMDELGRVVYNVCNIVPGGVVCFFPSYEYEKIVYSHWEQGGFLQKILARKKIFREPKKACHVDQVLNDYSSCIKKSLLNKYSAVTGALLLCVVGGKMSEGINFSDNLGRCVVMVGLPYPNLRSPELKEKMDYLNANMPKFPDGKLPGQVHYENLCMKAVNQSIGRAIRHRNDYAAILMLDSRYLRPSMRSKLPGWIGQHLQTMDRFGPAFAAIRKFFAGRREDCE